MRKSDFERRSIVTGVKLPPKVHECPRPDQNRTHQVKPGDGLYGIAPGWVEVVRASYPIGSTWRCPECGALWRVVNPSTPWVSCFYNVWRKTSSGFWWRLFHRPEVNDVHNDQATEGHL